MNFIITKDKSKVELAQYLHDCAFSLYMSTFQAVINKGNFISWPGINNLNFKMLLGTPLATSLEHLNQEKKNLQSTKFIKENDTDKLFPLKESKTHNWFYKVIDKERK